MAAVQLSIDAIGVVKSHLVRTFPGEKSSHISEALAYACGYKSHAALIVDFKCRGGNYAEYRLLSVGLMTDAVPS